jgi:uncharacterized membrane protein YjjP (DUF1212 family)
MILPQLKIGKFTFKPFIATLFGTLASGTTYVVLNKIILSLPMEAAAAAFITVVIPVTVFNSIITLILYHPAKGLIK